MNRIDNFQFEPVVASATTAENLALACVLCSLGKGARQEFKDSETDETVMIFHPRQQKWQEYFCGNGLILIGLIEKKTRQDWSI
ncbi:MAG: hypothetical protein ABI417_05485 [Coleofasciculaceae cyanobacterium]